MILTLKHYYSDTNHLHGIKIVNEIIISRGSDWDLFIYPLGFIIDNKYLWEIVGVDEI